MIHIYTWALNNSYSLVGCRLEDFPYSTIIIVVVVTIFGLNRDDSDHTLSDALLLVKKTRLSEPIWLLQIKVRHIIQCRLSVLGNERPDHAVQELGQVFLCDFDHRVLVCDLVNFFFGDQHILVLGQDQETIRLSKLQLEPIKMALLLQAGDDHTLLWPPILLVLKETVVIANRKSEELALLWFALLRGLVVVVRADDLNQSIWLNLSKQ